MKNTDINVLYFLDLLKKRWWGIAIAALIGATAAFSYGSFMVAPLYKSAVKMYADPPVGDQLTIQAQTQGLTYASNIINTYIGLLETNEFLDKVSDALENQYSSSQLAKMISFSIAEEKITKLFTITVVAPTPEHALLIAETAARLAPERITEITRGNDVVSIADPPRLPRLPANDNTSRNTLLGIVLGTAFAVALIVLVDMFDVRVKSEEDLVNTYEIPVLGSVPNFEKIYRSKSRKAGKKATAQTK